MKSALIAVGCNQYDHLGDLAGAEYDAQRIFEKLTDPIFGMCSTSLSTLIQSPTLSELQKRLAEATSNIDQGDSLTFFFAGHGYVKGGIFYMCLRDTKADRIGVTALPLNNLLSLIQEIAPCHANLVIDACNSGGVIGDFRRALSPDNIGSATSTGISLLAACASDQSAYEVDGAGVCTSCIIKCIDGSTFIQDLTDNLDLTEISVSVSQQLSSPAQQPMYWGLNLTARPNFCKNPHCSDDGEIRRTLAEAAPLNLPAETKKALQSIYSELGTEWEPGTLRSVLEQIFENERLPYSTKLAFANQLIPSLRAKTQSSTDPFLDAEVTITCLAPLITSCAEHKPVDDFVIKESEKLLGALDLKFVELADLIESDNYLLVGDAALAELYLLPLRISKIIGWLGWAIYSKNRITGSKSVDPVVLRILSALLSKYSGSLRAMSDAQAPHMFMLAALAANGVNRETLEEILGVMFYDACEHAGFISQEDLQPDCIIDFLILRSAKARKNSEFAAAPSMLLSTLIVLGMLFELDDAFDEGLEDHDHSHINIFVPESYKHFSKTRIEEGYNASFQIGHGIWRIEDFRRKWIELSYSPPESIGISILSVACSLVFPDRIAWHIATSEPNNFT